MPSTSQSCYVTCKIILAFGYQVQATIICLSTGSVRLPRTHDDGSDMISTIISHGDLWIRMHHIVVTAMDYSTS